MPDFPAWAAALLPEVIAALALLIAGAWLARWAERAFIRLLERHRIVDPTFRGVLTALVRYSILLLAVLASLQQLGLRTTSILAALGAVLVAVGLALQGTLSNLAAGLMLLWLRPFRVGDAIETASVTGNVVEVGLFATEVHRLDGAYVFVPNSDLWNRPLANLSRLPNRVVTVRLTLKKPEEIEAVRERLVSVAASQPLVRKTPPPTVEVAELTDVGLVVHLRAWVDSTSYRQAAAQLAERAAAALLSSERLDAGPSGQRSA